MQYRFCHSWLVLLLTITCVSLLACSSGGAETPTGSTTGTEGDKPVEPAEPNDNTPRPPDFSLDAPALVLGPEIAVIVRPTGTDLVVAYSDEKLQAFASVDYIVGEWENMKLCLDTTTAAPYIVIVDGFLQSVPSDDVLFNFEGRRLASATWNKGEVNVVRVSSLDFDGSQGNAGFHLRSIFGRFLWTLSELPARDYDTTCASGN